MRELEALMSQDFLLQSLDATPDALHRTLSGSRYVEALAVAIVAGDIQECDVSNFVNSMLRQAPRIAASFPHDIALAAICVAIQSRATPFADDFCTRVAKAKGIPLASGVARICMRFRSQFVASASLELREVPFPAVNTASTALSLGVA